jgi:hypothetical protein
MFATAVVGLSMGFSLCYTQSENRLLGHEENSRDVSFWTERADYERKVISGEIIPRRDGSWLDKKLFAVFGPKLVDLQSEDTKYHQDK